MTGRPDARVPDVAALVDTSLTGASDRHRRGPSPPPRPPPPPPHLLRTVVALRPGGLALYMMMNCILASWRRGRMLAATRLDSTGLCEQVPARHLVCDVYPVTARIN